MARKLKTQPQVLSGSPSSQFTNYAQAPIESTRAPTTADTGYAFGQLWVDTSTGIIYGLGAVSGGSATWNLMSPGSSDVDTLTGDSGGAISPTGGTIAITGGTNITTVGTAGPGTITFNLDAAITLATSVSSPIYTVAAATDMNINAASGQDIIMKMGDNAAANKVSFTDSDDAEVFSIDSNGGIGTLTGLTVTGAFTQTAGVVSISEDNSANAVGIGNGTTARTIDLGSSAAAHVITIGSVTGAAQLDLLAGTGNFSVTGAATTVMTIGTGLTSGTITIGATGNTGTMTISPSTGAQQVDIANADGAKTINMGAGVDGNTISIGNGVNTSAQTINVANGASAADTTVNIMSGVGTAGAGVLAIGNNTRVTTIGIADIAPAAARTVTVCGGDSAQNDTFALMSDNPSAGTQTVTILGGVPTGGTQALNLLTQTGQAGTVNIGTGAAMANAINIGGTGANTIAIGNTQTGGSVAIGDAMTTGTIDIGGSGAQTGTITIGGGTGAQTLDIGTGGTGIKTINLGTGAIGNVITIGTVTAAASLDLLVGTGNFTLEGNVASTYTISGTGANTGTINIGTGTGAQTTNLATGGTGIKTVNIATGAVANVVTMGSTTGAASLTLQAGTGEITVTGTVKEIDAEFLEASGDEITSFSQSPILTTAANTAGAATGANGDVNLMYLQQGVLMEQFIIGTQTIIGPRMDTNGLLVSLDLTAAEGAEYNFGAARTNSRHAFTVGTSAAFFFEVGLYINDMDGADPYVIGFRKAEANNATMASYTDYAAIGMNAASSVTNIVTMTELNSGGQTVTDTTDAWGGDGSTNTLRVLVDGAGAVTYTINGSAPSASAAFTFDAGDVVVPYIHCLHSASATQVNITSLKVGFQA